MEDSIVWNLDRRKGFSVSSLTSAAMDVKGQEVDVDLLPARVWRNLAPPKVEFMVWLALLGKLHTKNLLFMKGLIPAQEVLYIFYGRALETVDHVLVSCHLAWRLWCEASQGWGVHLVFPDSLRSLFELWMDIRTGGKFMKKVWESIFYAVVWTIWSGTTSFFVVKLFNLNISCILSNLGLVVGYNYEKTTSCITLMKLPDVLTTFICWVCNVLFLCNCHGLHLALLMIKKNNTFNEFAFFFMRRTLVYQKGNFVICLASFPSLMICATGLSLKQEPKTTLLTKRANLRKV